MVVAILGGCHADGGQVNDHVDGVGQVDDQLAMFLALVKSMAMLMVLVGIMGDD